MSSRSLPARPNLDHLKREAKALQRDVNAGDAASLARLREALGAEFVVPVRLRLTDAQRAIARAYGFASWHRLRAHVLASGDPATARDAFLAFIQWQDRDGARRVLASRPSLPSESLHVAAALGEVDMARRLLAEDSSRVSSIAGDPPATPLLFLGFTPFHGESAKRDAGLFATATLLLDAGADPNAKDGRFGVPVLYSVTGMHHVIPIAKLLLAAGADPTDGESVYHAAERFHEEALELLWEAGVDLNVVGDWGNTPLYFLLRGYDLAESPLVRRGVDWLLAHGADPNVVCREERETSLHAAARRGQPLDVIEALLAHGADVHAARGDGRTPWRLAKRGGHDAIAERLERAGAERETLDAAELLLAACGRGDAEGAAHLARVGALAALSPEDLRLLPEAADAQRETIVRACLAAGFDASTRDAIGATALHYAGLRGRAGLVHDLVAAGANITIRDNEHQATPLGWVLWGADNIARDGGEYGACTEILLRAGAEPPDEERWPTHKGVRAVLRRAGR